MRLTDVELTMTSAQDLQVLLVEDSTVICNLIATIVNNVAGVSVSESVGSEADAIEAVNHGNVDVVILDLQLRSGTGFGVLRAMRKMVRRPAVVILLIDRGTPEDCLWAALVYSAAALTDLIDGWLEPAPPRFPNPIC